MFESSPEEIIVIGETDIEEIKPAEATYSQLLGGSQTVSSDLDSLQGPDIDNVQPLPQARFY